MSETISTATRAAWCAASREELAHALREREDTIRRLHAEQDAILAEIQARGTQAEYGYRDPATLQMDLLRITRAEANQRLNRATLLHPARTVSGAELAPLAPATAAAAAAGVIGPAHVDQILKTLVDIPDAIPAAERAEYEHTLVQLAGEADPKAVRTCGTHLLARLDQDGKPPNEPDQAHPQRELHVGWRRDGRLGLTGILDPEAGAYLQTLLSPLAKPRPAENGERDARSAPERNGDALADLLHRFHQAADLPVEAGYRPTVMVTMQLDDLTQALTTHGVVRGGDGATLNDLPISVAQARRLACDADILPAVLGSNGEVLDLGRSERLATRAQRRALIRRDKGCIKCRRPPQWAQVHHIIHWLDGGLTDLDNLCLLCSECHRLIHHSDWRIEMINDKPKLHPPPWLKRE